MKLTPLSFGLLVVSAMATGVLLAGLPLFGPAGLPPAAPSSQPAPRTRGPRAIPGLLLALDRTYAIGPEQVVRGSVQLIADRGEVRRQPDGRLEFGVSTDGRRTSKHSVQVRAGEWSLELEEGSTVTLGQAVLDGRPASLDGSGPRYTFDGGPVLLTARWPGPAIVRVVDERTGQDLAEVDVLRVPRGIHVGEHHPGEPAPDDLLATGLPSPIDLTALLHGRGEHGADTPRKAFFVRSPGLAWARTIVDFDRRAHEPIRLVRGGGLAMTVDGLPSGLAVMFRLRSPGTGSERTALDMPIRSASFSLDSIAPGPYRVEVAVGPPSQQTVLAATHVQIAADQVQELHLELGEVPPATPAPIAGRVRFPSGWDTRGAELQFHARPRMESISLHGGVVEPGTGMRVVPFSFPALAPGPCEVTTTPWGHRYEVTLPERGASDVEILLGPRRWRSALEAWYPPKKPLIEGAGEFLVAAFRSSGCYRSVSAERWFQREGDRFVSEQRAVDGSLVRDLRQRVLASRDAPDPLPTYLERPGELLERLGICPEYFDEVAQEYLESYVVRRWDRSALLVPELRVLAEPERLRLRFVSSLLEDVESTTSRRLEYWIPGEPALRLTSSRDSLYMLPWTAEADGSTWEVYDLDVVEILIRLSPAGGLEASSKIADWTEPGSQWWSMSGIRHEVHQLMESRSRTSLATPEQDGSSRSPDEHDAGPAPP